MADGTGEIERHGTTYIVLKFMLSLTFQVFAVMSWMRSLWHKFSYMALETGAHHHRSPALIRKDARRLSKIPAHVAVVLSIRAVSSDHGSIEGLLFDAGEIFNWCIGAGCTELTIYERTGALKQLPAQDLARKVQGRLETYFGADGLPSFEVRSTTRPTQKFKGATTESFRINLLSAEDGRPVIVDLARSLSEQVKQGTLEPSAITVSSVDAYMLEHVGSEPDLLLMFGPRVDLQGYPPWQIRVSELFYLPNNDGVNYLVFRRALEKFAKVKINLGK